MQEFTEYNPERKGRKFEVQNREVEWETEFENHFLGRTEGLHRFVQSRGKQLAQQIDQEARKSAVQAWCRLSRLVTRAGV